MTVQNKPDNHKLLRCWLLWIFNSLLSALTSSRSRAEWYDPDYDHGSGDRSGVLIYGMSMDRSLKMLRYVRIVAILP